MKSNRTARTFLVDRCGYRARPPAERGPAGVLLSFVDAGEVVAMPKAGFIVTRVSFLVLAASMLGAAMLAAPAAGQTSTCSGKCFSVAVSPPSSTSGQASFSFTITNEDSMQTLGSVKITALAGFMITGASCTPLPGCVTSSSALFINLNLQPGATTSTPLTVNVTPSGSGGTY